MCSNATTCVHHFNNLDMELHRLSSSFHNWRHSFNCNYLQLFILIFALTFCWMYMHWLMKVSFFSISTQHIGHSLVPSCNKIFTPHIRWRKLPRSSSLRKEIRFTHITGCRYLCISSFQHSNALITNVTIIYRSNGTFMKEFASSIH